MPNDVQNASPQQTDNWFVDGLKKQTASILFAAVFGFYIFFWNSHDAAKDQKYQVEANRLAIEKSAVVLKEQGESINQLLIALTKLSEAQNRLASDVKDMQDQQRRNTESLMNRK